MRKQTLLVILAHPDDESFGAGGTFAKCAAEGVDVHICIATDGAAGSIEAGFEHAHDNLAAVRARELQVACQVLGATPHWLGYRDSGMAGDPANMHPDAFVQSDDQEAVGRVVQLIRKIRPTVIVTHDETGGYFHPDHIRCWAVVTMAFAAAADETQYTQFAALPHQAKRLYYTAFSNKWTKFFTWALRLRGENPKRVGRNNDIDVTRLGISAEKLHAHIDYAAYWEVKETASAAHATQGGGNGGPFRFIPKIIRRKLLSTDTFIRAYPPTPDGFRETSLFP